MENRGYVSSEDREDAQVVRERRARHEGLGWMPIRIKLP